MRLKTMLLEGFLGGKFYQIWVGGVAEFQTSPEVRHPKNRLFFTRISPFMIPNLTKKTLGGFTDLGKLSQKKAFL